VSHPAVHPMPPEVAAPRREVLVVAPMRYVPSQPLVAALRAHAAGRPCAFTLVVAATPWGWAWLADMFSGADEADRRLCATRTLLAAAGVSVREARIGDPDPLAAVMDAVNRARFDEIVVCAAPGRVARRLGLSLAQRTAWLTGVPVRHVAGPAIAARPRREGPAPRRLQRPAPAAGTSAGVR